MEEIKGLTLADALHRLGDTPICIGAATSWFYFGPADQAGPVIEQADTDFIREEYNAYCKRRHLWISDLYALEKSLIVKRVPRSLREARALRKIQARKIREYAALVHKMPFAKQYKPLKHRTVKDAYPSCANDGFYRIVVEGCGTGKYWTYTEYLDGHGQKKLAAEIRRNEALKINERLSMAELMKLVKEAEP